MYEITGFNKIYKEYLYKMKRITPPCDNLKFETRVSAFSLQCNVKGTCTDATYSCCFGKPQIT